MEKCLYGKRDYLHRPDSIKIYSETGLDVDGRQEIIRKLMKHVTQTMADMLTFANQIPGFVNLSQRDKVKLIKCKFC